eukprot:362512_1
MAIVNKSSIWLTEVMFSYIEPYKFIPRHRGPYSGVFRYQLSLEIPPNVSDPEKDLYLAVWPGTASTDWWDPNNTPKDKPQILGWTPGSDFFLMIFVYMKLEIIHLIEELFYLLMLKDKMYHGLVD